MRDADGKPAFIAVRRSQAGWPHLALSFRHGIYAGFPIGVLVVPETDVLLVGSETRLLAYDLKGPRRLWMDTTMPGFWYWRRHGDIVLMGAELELVAYSLDAERLWSRFVEPPWGYTVAEGRVRLDVMGEVSTFPLRTGP